MPRCRLMSLVRSAKTGPDTSYEEESGDKGPKAVNVQKL